MPEGPEVYCLWKRLTEKLDGEKLVEITDTRKQRTIPIDYSVVVGSGVVVSCKGKLLCFDFGTRKLFVHMMLTGRFTDSPTKFTTVTMKFTTVTLYFEDKRGFSVWHLVEPKIDEFVKLGPSVINLSEADFKKAVFGVKGVLCAVLLKQEILSGIGNYLRAEILWKAGFRHDVRIENCDHDVLYRAITEIVQEAVDNDGSVEYDGEYVPRVYKRKVSEDGKRVKICACAGRKLYYVEPD